MEIDAKIERIENGYIVTGNDSTKTRTYYPTLYDFVNAWVVEPLKEKDKNIREHSVPYHSFDFKLKTDL